MRKIPKAREIHSHPFHLAKRVLGDIEKSQQSCNLQFSCVSSSPGARRITAVFAGAWHGLVKVYGKILARNKIKVKVTFDGISREVD